MKLLLFWWAEALGLRNGLNSIEEQFWTLPVKDFTQKYIMIKRLLNMRLTNGKSRQMETDKKIFQEWRNAWGNSTSHSTC